MVIRVPDQRNTPGGYAALDDRLLVLDFQAGNPQAFVEIHRRYGALARHVCQRFLPMQQDVDEAFQETMIRVFQGLYRFNGRYALQPWIARIAKNVSLDILRGHARRPQTDSSAPASDELPVPGDQADEIVERLVQRDTVLSVMADLPETHRRALMLREFEGRSHREVAQELEITTPQAKALIHRAKGSFRRLWLEKVADRGGFMGFAFLPLLWLARLGGGLRRVGDRLGYAAQAAHTTAPDAVTSTVTASAAPAASGVAERLVAAGVTLLIAGGVTVGAARVVNDRRENDSVDRVSVTTAAPVPLVAKDQNDPPADDPRAERSTGKQKEAEPPIVIAPIPSSTVAPSPAPEPSPSPTDEPPPDPSPTPPPSPPWSLAFDSSIPLGSFDFREVSSRSIGNVEEGLAFSQAIEGLPTSESSPVQRIYLEFLGSIEPGRGVVNVLLLLDTAEGRYRYDGLCSLDSVVLAADGSSNYVLIGNYSRTDGPIGGEALPSGGTARVALDLWSDGSLYGTELSLVEHEIG